MIDDRLLIAPKRVVSEYLLQNGERIVAGRRHWGGEVTKA
jgi:hypothetical protein